MTKLVECFSKNGVDINHELKLLHLESKSTLHLIIKLYEIDKRSIIAVDVEGSSTKVQYSKKYTLEERLKYSHSPVHWQQFVRDITELYQTINEVKT